MKKYIFSLILSSTICATGRVFAMLEDVELNSTGIPARFEKTANGLEITTDDNNWASYQAMSQKFNVKSGDKLHVEGEVEVGVNGIMCFGWLNTGKDGWYVGQNASGEHEAEVVFSTGNHAVSFDRTVPEGEKETELVLRNYHLGTPGQTTFTLKKLQMRIEPAAPGVNLGIVSKNVSSVQEFQTICDVKSSPLVKQTYGRLNISVSSGDMDRVPISFTNIFQAYPDLTELTISKMTLGITDLGASRIEDLASVLAKNPPLKKLSLLSCGVDDISVQHLVNSLATNTNLEEIKLEVNKITDVGAQAMGELLKINKTLKTLSLMGNQAMTDAGISAVAQVLYDLPNPTLESLDVMGIPTQKTLQQQANLAAHLKLKNVTIKFN